MRMEDYNPSLEFGIDNATYDHMKGQVDDFFDNIIKNRDYNKLKYLDDDNSEEIEQNLLNDPNLVTCFEKHGWDAVKDFYDEFSVLEDGQKYKLLFDYVEWQVLKQLDEKRHMNLQKK
jgi:hypothetical protein